MIREYSLFNIISDVNFLIYAWKDLKKKSNFCYLGTASYYTPVGKLWFEKISYRLKKNSFNYKKKESFSLSKYGLKKKTKISAFIQIRIIEMAIISIVRPYFFKVFYFKNFDIIKCVRLELRNMVLYCVY